MTPRQKRLGLIVAGVAALGIAVGLVLYALNSNLVFFYTPTQVSRHEVPEGRAFRLGGLVEPGSVQRDGTRVSFRVTDSVAIVPVTYVGTLPDLFREGQGVVAQGRLGANGEFTATEVLAKHDENYMPPEAAEALRQAGHPVDAYKKNGKEAGKYGGQAGGAYGGQGAQP